VPPDDPTRKLSIINPDDPALRHVSVLGDTYTILLSGAETAGRYCLIDMNVPHCGGPGPHRHDFDEHGHVNRWSIVRAIRWTGGKVARAEVARSRGTEGTSASGRFRVCAARRGVMAHRSGRGHLRVRERRSFSSTRSALSRGAEAR